MHAQANCQADLRIHIATLLCDALRVRGMYVWIFLDAQLGRFFNALIVYWSD